MTSASQMPAVPVSGSAAETLEPATALSAADLRTWRTAAWVADGVQLAAAGFLLDFLLFGSTGVSVLLRLVVLAGLLLTTLRSLGWPVLLAIQLSLLIREPSHRDMLHGLHSLMSCLAAIGVVAYASSFQSTRREFRNLFAATVHTAVHRDRVPLPAHLQAPQYPSLAIRACVLVALVLASMLIFIDLPIAAPVRDQWWQRSRADGLVLWPGPWVVVLGLALMVIFWQSQWRHMNPAQARLYLRSTFMHYHYRDLRMIVLRRLKASRSRAAKSR